MNYQNFLLKFLEKDLKIGPSRRIPLNSVRYFLELKSAFHLDFAEVYGNFSICQLVSDKGQKRF